MNTPAAPRLISLATALPAHRVRQSDVKALASRMFGPAMSALDQRLLGVFDSTGIETRSIVEPLEWYDQPRGFGEMNAAYVEHALELAVQAIARVLEPCGLSPADIDHLVFVSSTGVSTPSLDARIANRLPMRADFRRTPIWGLGCAGGAAGLARAGDFARADPRARVMLVALELCSLTFQRHDMDRRGLIAASLFSDGAAAALVAGPEAPPCPTPFPPLELLAARSTLWNDTLDVMGWTVDDTGLHVVFARHSHHRARVGAPQHRVVPGRARPRPGAPHARGRASRRSQGAGRVLRGARAAGRCVPACVRGAARLRQHVLAHLPVRPERALAAGDFAPGDTGLLAALGPGFSSELLLLRRAA